MGQKRGVHSGNVQVCKHPKHMHPYTLTSHDTSKQSQVHTSRSNAECRIVGRAQGRNETQSQPAKATCRSRIQDCGKKRSKKENLRGKGLSVTCSCSEWSLQSRTCDYTPAPAASGTLSTCLLLLFEARQAAPFFQAVFVGTMEMTAGCG